MTAAEKIEAQEAVREAVRLAEEAAKAINALSNYFSGQRPALNQEFYLANRALRPLWRILERLERRVK